MKKVIRDIPSCFTQEEFKSKKAQIDTRGVSKSAVMEGDPKCTNLIEDSLYNTKHFHCIIMVSEDSNWVVRDKEFFNIDTVKVKS